MFSHVTIGTTDLARAAAFYDAALAPLGIKARAEQVRKLGRLAAPRRGRRDALGRSAL
jgi:catechol 2,3-dioxygenase-like lactoylglutathione lyase family enzyme